MIYLMFGFALALSTVAAFYAIFGLVAIFAAAPIAIIILGSLLEGSKLVIASWLYRNWKQVPFLLRTYFLSALVILMFLTSVGIFGFLSAAHIEQAALGTEGQAQVVRLEKEIARQSATLERAEGRFNQLQTTGLGADSNVQSQIDAEQRRIDSAYERIQPAINEQQLIIDSQTKLLQNELDQIDQQINSLQRHLDTNDVLKAQSVVGVRADGQFGPATSSAVRKWQSDKQQQRQSTLKRIQSANDNPTIKAARDEIQRVRLIAESQLAESNNLINRLRGQLGNVDSTEIEAALKEQQEVIQNANVEIDTFTQQKYELEADIRRLEVEVGPIKYIAEMVYGDQPDTNTLEKAVRIMIILLVIVFDPLAVLMLIAANWSLIQSRPKPFVEVSDNVRLEDGIQEPEFPTHSEEPQDPVTTIPPLPRTHIKHYISKGADWISRPPKL